MKTGVVSWDWKDVVNWDDVNVVIKSREMMFPIFYEVEDTGGDSFAVVISDTELSAQQVQDVYNKFCDNEEDDI